MSKYKDSYAKSPSFSTFVVSFAFAVVSIGGLCVWAVTPDKPISIKKTEKIKKVEEPRLLRCEKTTKLDKPISIKKTEKISKQEAEKIKKVEELRLLRWEKTTCPHGKVDY